METESGLKTLGTEARVHCIGPLASRNDAMSGRHPDFPRLVTMHRVTLQRANESMDEYSTTLYLRAGGFVIAS